MTPIPGLIGTSKSFLDPVAVGPTANTDRTGTTGTLYTLKTAGAFGSEINWVRFIAVAATVANVIRFYYVDAGAVIRLLDEMLVEALTPSVSVVGFSKVWVPPSPTTLAFGQTSPMILPPSCLLKCNIEITQTFQATISGNDL